MPLSPGTRIGAYEITSQLGAGGMGEVYRAKDSKLKREVALKVLPADVANDRERMARFQREAEVLASLNHPNIAQIYGIEEGDGPAKAGHHIGTADAGHHIGADVASGFSRTTALVMELVEGEDLAERLKRGAIPLDEALPIAKQIAEALEAAHAQGIIHRDLKPANVKVRPDGTVKVLDFGLAKALSQDPKTPGPQDLANSPTITSPAMTMRGVILGTAAYMAPEQAKGKAVDKRADIWAFGVVLFEMLSGTRAFEGEDITDTIVAVVSKQPDWSRLPADTPPALRRVLRKCLEKDARKRLRDIGDVGIDLDETGGHEPESPVSTAQERNGIWALAPWGLSALLAIALIAGWVASRPSGNVAPDAGMVRFTLVDDPNMQVRFSSQPFATSPDGKTVVFSAAAGTTGLWVRSLDQPTPRFLSGTEGGHQPAIAPDGQWVAFVVANHIIKKVRLTGGAPTTIVALDDVTAAIAWESVDSIVFEKIGSGSGIHRVNANGGQPELLIPLSGNEEGHYFPVVLGEPRLVFFASSSSGGRATRGMPASGAVTGEGTTLSVFSLADRRRSDLNLDGIRALGLIDGHLVYARADGSLMAAPFDARGLRVLGEPRLLDPRVSPGRFGPSVILSETGTLVSLPAVSPLSRMVLVDAQGRATPIGEARAFDSPRFSADGSRIAVGIAEGDGLDLWTLDRATAAATRVTRSGPPSVKLESWTPDGQSLIHMRNSELWTVVVNGSAEPRKLFEVEGRVLGASMLSGGQSVAVLRRIRVGQGNLDREELIRVPLTGDQTAVPIYSSRSSGSVLRGLDPRASPDGRWVAIHDRNDDQVHVRAIDGGAGLQVSDLGGSMPVWGHDSRRLYYRTAAGTMEAELQAAPTVAVVGRRLVAGIPAAATLHDVSADGKSFLLLVPVDPAPKVQVTVNWAADVVKQLRGSPP